MVLPANWPPKPVISLTVPPGLFRSMSPSPTKTHAAQGGLNRPNTRKSARMAPPICLSAASALEADTGSTGRCGNPISPIPAGRSRPAPSARSSGESPVGCFGISKAGSLPPTRPGPTAPTPTPPHSILAAPADRPTLGRLGSWRAKTVRPPSLGPTTTRQKGTKTAPKQRKMVPKTYQTAPETYQKCPAPPRPKAQKKTNRRTTRSRSTSKARQNSSLSKSLKSRPPGGSSPD